MTLNSDIRIIPVDIEELLNSIDIELGYYSDLGYRLSIRQLYYCVRRDIDLEMMTFKRFSRRVHRYASQDLIDWESIINFDIKNSVMPFAGPRQFLRNESKKYVFNAWKDQDSEVECVSDVDISGVVSEVCRKNAIIYTPVRSCSDIGFNPVLDRCLINPEAVVLYVGDSFGKIRAAYPEIENLENVPLFKPGVCNLPCAAVDPETVGFRVESAIIKHVTHKDKFNSALKRQYKDAKKIYDISAIYGGIKIRGSKLKTSSVLDNDTL